MNNPDGIFKPTDWYRIGLGSLFGACIYGSIGVLIVMNLGAIKSMNWVVFTLVFLFIIYSFGLREGKSYKHRIAQK